MPRLRSPRVGRCGISVQTQCPDLHFLMDITMHSRHHLMQRCMAEGHVHPCPPRRSSQKCFSQHRGGAHHTVTQSLQQAAHRAAALAMSLMVSGPGEPYLRLPMLWYLLVDQLFVYVWPHTPQQAYWMPHSARLNESGRVPCKVDMKVEEGGGGARLPAQLSWTVMHRV